MPSKWRHVSKFQSNLNSELRCTFQGIVRILHPAITGWNLLPIFMRIWLMIFSLHNVYRTYCRWREFCQEASDKCISYQYIYVSETRWIQFIIIRLYQLTCNEFLNIDFLFWVKTLRVPIMIYCIFCRNRKLTKITKTSYFNVENSL